MTFNQVSLISHSDWSKNHEKRWMAVAVLQANQRWLVCELSRVSDSSGLFLYLKSRRLKPGCILSGFDFPIGVPYSYALLAGITDFLATLPLFGQNEWDQFYIPAKLSSEINLYRPFYPDKPGGTNHSHLECGLDLPFGHLYRLCEMSHDNRRSACPLFWTMGAQQVGKAAITGWKDLLAPAVVDHKLKVKIWPFSGSLSHICQTENIVVVETYPAEFYNHLGLSFSSPSRRSKRRRLDRLAFAEQLISWAETHNFDLDDSIVNSVINGFGDNLDGEDRFDALVGLYGMINVVLGFHPAWEPNLPHISKIEGWIFGENNPNWITGVDRITS
jgi:hypothetical protein